VILPEGIKTEHRKYNKDMNMSRTLILATFSMILLIGMLGVAFKVEKVKAGGTIYIRADGSIDPPTVPISTADNVTYTFTDNIYDPIVVERDNVTIVGAGYTLQRTGVRTGVGIELSERRNVKVTNTTIQSFDYGIKCLSPFSSNISIFGNNIIGNRIGIFLSYSSNNSITNNVFTGDGLVAYESYGNLVENNFVNCKPLVYLEGVSNYVVEDAGQVILLNCSNIRIENLNLSITDDAIQLGGTNNTIITNNHITANSEYGILLFASSNNNSIVGNNIANNSCGMWLETFSNNNSIFGNNITNNSHGIFLGGGSRSNRIFHNNFMRNTQQTDSDGTSVNSWDDGYPSGGNYWSDYNGTDSLKGPYQNLTGSDGVGDVPYKIPIVHGNGQTIGFEYANYSLMAAINFFDVGVWNGESQEVHVISNSTISNFQVNEAEKIINFNVAGEAGFGFCRVTIPNLVEQELWGGNYTVLVDGKRVETGNWTDAENTYIYFTYEHSEHNVTILQTYTTTLQIEKTTGGSTDPPPDLCFYLIGDVVSVLATPDSNYRFEYWILNGVNIGSQNPVEVLMDSNHSLQAVFTQITHRLTITSTEGGTTDPAPGTHTYVNGTVVLVTALPDVGYSFDYWRREGEVRTVNPIIILVAADGTLKVFFVDDIRPEIGEPVQDPRKMLSPTKP